MSIIRRKFSKEQKLEIVKQSMEEGVNLLDLGNQYSLHVNTIYKWRQTFLSNEEICFPGNGNVVLTEMEKENLKLKKQLREAELERDILKKAIRIFSKSDGKFTDL